MHTPPFTVVRTTRTSSDADLLITAMRSEGLNPLDLETAGHFTLSGTDISFHIYVPTAELAAAGEFLGAYDHAIHVA